MGSISEGNVEIGGDAFAGRLVESTVDGEAGGGSGDADFLRELRDAFAAFPEGGLHSERESGLLFRALGANG